MFSRQSTTRSKIKQRTYYRYHIPICKGLVTEPSVPMHHPMHHAFRLGFPTTSRVCTLQGTAKNIASLKEVHMSIWTINICPLTIAYKAFKHCKWEGSDISNINYQLSTKVRKHTETNTYIS